MKKLFILFCALIFASYLQGLSLARFEEMLKTIVPIRGTNIETIQTQQLEQIINSYGTLPHSTAVRQADETIQVWLGTNINNMRNELATRNTTSLTATEAKAV